ncbi:probable transmembrane reductase CYB561D1 [Euwallacea fornicatus]|uniref:probable transmembrane reductase CYB561D1 n=1 Tax=Euwallacea fornicatus TaxID=995702 RepID=UPI00338DB6E7
MSSTEKSENLGNLTTNLWRYSCNYLTKFGIAGIVVYSCWIAIINYNYWFSWHIMLCTFGYLPLMAESIMLFNGDELWSKQISRTAKYTVHGVVVTVATLMILVGDALVFHYLQPGYHLYTVHGITGLISLILILLSVPSGLMIKYYREVNPYLSMRLIWVKAIHNLLSLIGYAVGIISLVYAYYTNWFVYYTDYASRLVAVIVTLLAGAWTMNGAIVSLYHQINSIFSN